jgi:hypothetical protein
VVAARAQHGRERLAEIAAVRDADRLDSGERVDHLRGADRQPGAAQHAHEMQHVVGQVAARRQRRVPGAQRHRGYAVSLRSVSGERMSAFWRDGGAS